MYYCVILARTDGVICYWAVYAGFGGVVYWVMWAMSVGVIYWCAMWAVLGGV